ncbi:hypothetical protein K438DRAFT_1958923 [Mycena galopus ATCC 62051]|nr:hypothetical protein K438DRAFT_1958923 [Mycena galopus ATCC 62051]
MNWLDLGHPRVQVHVPCMQLDAERLDGEGPLASVASTVPASLAFLNNDLTRALATIFSGDPPNPQCSRCAPACPTAGMGNINAVRGARCVHSPSHTLFSLPPARDDYLQQCPGLPRLSFSRSPSTIHAHHHPHAERSRGSSPSAVPRPRTTTIDMWPLRLPGLPSTQ